MSRIQCCNLRPDGSKEAERLFKNLQDDDLCVSLLKTHLTPARLDHLKKLKTKYGGTLAHCIRSGCLNTDCDVGLYACDPDAYKTFSDLFFPIIKDHHKVNDVNQPPVSFGEKFVSLATFDLDSELILSTCVSVSRNLEGFPFPPLMIAEKRKHLEIMSRAALKELRGELRGIYCPLTSVTRETRISLLGQNMMPTNNNRFLEAAGAYRQWPEGRGVYFNETTTFVAWVNHDDHLKLMSTQPRGAFRKAYLKLFHALKHLERSGLQYVWREQLGEDTGPAEAEKLWKQLQLDLDSNKSLLAKHLTKDALKELKSVKTTFGGTLVHQIKAGVTHPDLQIGLYASDQDAYTAFASLYDPVIKDYYQVSALEHPDTYYGNPDDMVELEAAEVDPNCKYIQKIQIEIRRNLEGYAFGSIITKDKRELIEKILRHMLRELHCGKYNSMFKQHEDMYELLVKADLVMKDDNKYLRTAGAYRMYPFHRGIWGTYVGWMPNPLFIYVNHEDHLRLFAIEYSSKLTACYKLMQSETITLRRQHFFAKRAGLGYLTFNPEHIGTGMKVTIRIKLPNLCKTSDFEDFCKTNNFTVKPYKPQIDQGNPLEEDVYELSSIHNFGLTEVALIKEVSKGLKAVVEEEIKLEGKK